MAVVDVVNLDGKKVGQVELADAVFGAKARVVTELLGLEGVAGQVRT